MYERRQQKYVLIFGLIAVIQIGIEGIIGLYIGCKVENGSCSKYETINVTVMNYSIEPCSWENDILIVTYVEPLHNYTCIGTYSFTHLYTEVNNELKQYIHGTPKTVIRIDSENILVRFKCYTNPKNYCVEADKIFLSSPYLTGMIMLKLDILLVFGLFLYTYMYYPFNKDISLKINP
jgi:hypothetical protein